MQEEKEKVDREKTCPFFLRLLWKENGIHELSDYKEEPQYNNANEYHLYTWMDATIRELTDVAKTVIPVANKKDAKIVFYHVYQDTSGRFKRKEMGVVHWVKRDKNDSLSLSSIRFHVGDMIDIDIQTNKNVKNFN